MNKLTNSSLQLKILLSVLIGECFYIAFFLLNYDMAWMGNENFGTHAWILSNGHHWQWEDFGRAFNIDVLESNAYRLSRPLSNFMEVVNAKFRSNLWDLIPPHPSVSILWPFLFIVLPLSLYRFLRNLECEAYIALGACMMYMASLGFLGPIVMLFHPGKSLVSLLTVLTLLVASTVAKNKKSSLILSVMLTVSLLTCFLSDETGLFAYLMVIVFFIKEWRKLWIVLFVAPILYALSIKVFLPYMHFITQGKHIALQNYNCFPNPLNLIQPDWKNFVTNFYWLWQEHPGLRSNWDILWESNKVLWVLHGVYAIVIGTLVLLLIGAVVIRGISYSLFAGIILVIGYVFFFTFQLSSNAKVWGVWWYGSLYSLVFMIGFTLCLQHIAQAFKSRWGNSIVMLIILMTSIHTLVFSTYEVDIFAPKSEYLAYAQEKIFMGEMKDYYREFSLFDSIKKSRCIRLDILAKWSMYKHRPVVIDPKEQERCQQDLAEDKAYAYQSGYLPVELSVGK